MGTHGSLEAIVSFEISRPIEIVEHELTELGGRKNPLVEQNNAGTQSNPQAVDVRFDRDSRFERSQGKTYAM